MIWEYLDNTKLALSLDEEHRFRTDGGYRGDRFLVCQFCKTQMAGLEVHIEHRGEGYVRTHVEVCRACGWWVLTHDFGYNHGYEGYKGVRRAAGTLRNLDLADLTLPIDELSRYLLVHYEDRLQCHPRKYEEVVAGVFADLGYSTRVTSYSSDDGIDVFVFDGSDTTVGVQVKRYKGKISVEQIRSFAGALCLNGLTTGIFVTTSQFTTDAKNTAARYGQLGTRVHLWDADRFYDQLRVAKSSRFRSADDPNAPYYVLLRDLEAVPQVFADGW
jgi:restriction system protein